MFRQQNGLVDPMEFPLPISLSWVIKIKTDLQKSLDMARKKMYMRA